MCLKSIVTTLGSLLFCHLAQFSLSMRKEGRKERGRSHVNCVALLLRFQGDRGSIKLSDIADFVTIHPLKQRDAAYPPTISKRHPAQLGGNGDQLRLIELLESLMAGVWTSNYKYAGLMRNHFICIQRSCLHCGIYTQQNFAVYSILISRRCVAICSTLSIEAAESVVDLAFTNVAAIRSSSLVSRYIYY